MGARPTAQQHRNPSSPSNDCEGTCDSLTDHVGDHRQTCSISALGGMELRHTSQISSELHRPLSRGANERLALSRGRGISIRRPNVWSALISAPQQTRAQLIDQEEKTLKTI
jgi:hypothetical protein